MNKPMAEYEDALFSAAIHEAAKIKSAEYLREAEKYKAESQLSEFSDRRIKKLIDRSFRKSRTKSAAKRTGKVLGRVALGFAVFIAVTFTVVMSVEALRENFFRFMMTFYPEFTRLELIDSNEKVDGNGNILPDGQTIEISKHSFPSYIPEGFVIKNMILDGDTTDIYYENESDPEQYISFSEYSQNAVTHIDSENADLITTVMIKDNEGLMITKDGITSVSWPVDDRYIILFSSIDSVEVLKIAQSVEYNDK